MLRATMPNATTATTLRFTFIFVLISLALHVYIKHNSSGTRPENLDSLSTSKDAVDEFADTKHCNFLEDIQLREEANTLEKHGFELQKVIVIIRHGDRAPLRLVRNLEHLYCDKSYLKRHNADEKLYLGLVDSFFASKQNLVKWNVAPGFMDFPNERCKLARLTKFGVSQHIKLGYLLSEAYSAKLGLTPQTLVNNSVKVTSTRYSRTVQSAFSFLYGFHSQLNANIFENVPNVTFSVDPYFCGLDKSSHFCAQTCHMIANLGEKLHLAHLLEPIEVMSITELVEELRRIIAPEGSESAKYRSLVHIFDALNAYLCHHEELPCHSTHGCVSTSRVRDVHSYICLLGNKLQHSHAHRHSSWLKIYGFLNGLLEEMHQPNKFALYSGHDISIECLKSVLSIGDCSIPPYASRVIFEIYSKNGQKYTRILYNGNDVTANLGIEQEKHQSELTQNVSLVNVEHFRKYVHRNFEFYTRTEDYKVACGFGTNDRDTTADNEEGRV